MDQTALTPVVGIAADPASISAGETVALTATSPSAYPGATVRFSDSGVIVGVTLMTDRTALFGLRLGVGTHEIKAELVFVGPGGCGPRPSDPVAILVTATRSSAAVGGDLQYVEATVPIGVLSISSPYTPDHPDDVGLLALDPDGRRLSGRSAFGDGTFDGSIRIVDTRPGGSDWTASVQGLDLVSDRGARIAASSLGLVDLRVVPVEGNALTRQTVDVTDLPVESSGGGQGLSAVRAFARSTHGGAGVVGVAGALIVTAPPGTPPGAYHGTLILTIS